MAWELNEEQVMLIVKDHMKVRDEKMKPELSELYSKLIFFFLGKEMFD